MWPASCKSHFTYYHWTGFYRNNQDNLLVIGPYCGHLPCLVIPFDKGICGRCVQTGKPQVIDCVQNEADYIACSSTTQSEIVIPVIDKNQKVIAVLDIDSDNKAAFNETDLLYLTKVCQLLSEKSPSVSN